MSGKKKCRLLREIRQRIAEENDIPLVTEECRYKGDCRGTCPKCESELRYLEQQLEKRRALGKKVTVSALALGMAASIGGCRQILSPKLEGDVPYAEPETEIVSTEGIIAAPDTEPSTDETVPETTDPEEEPYALVGDVLYEPESDFSPEDNVSPTVYGPPATEAPPAAFDPGDNVEANIYGPPEMMESFNGNG